MNSGYKYYSIVNKNLVTELWFPRVKIPSKPVTGFIKENTKKPGVEITNIVKFSINIEGYRQNIFSYMVLTLSNLITMGLLSIKKENIIIRTITNTLIINSCNLTTSTKETLVSLKIKELIATPFATLIKGARKRKKLSIVFKVSLEDIIKALRLKIIRIPAKI